MSTMASQITSVSIVYSTVCSDADRRKHQSSASLAFVRGSHRSLVNSPHIGPVTRKMFPFDDVSMWSFPERPGALQEGVHDPPTVGIWNEASTLATEFITRQDDLQTYVSMERTHNLYMLGSSHATESPLRYISCHIDSINTIISQSSYQLHECLDLSMNCNDTSM